MADVVGLLNFRDLGGLRVADGRRLRSGAVFRSGAFDHFDGGTQSYLRRIGVGLVSDLRSTTEQRRLPSPLRAAGWEHWPEPHEIDHESALRVMGDPACTPADVRAAMIALYESMAENLVPVLRGVFHAAVTGRGGLLVHCAIGKDRTGVATALLLEALGATRQVVMEDYLASNAAKGAIYAALAARNAHRAPPPVAIVAPLIAADPAYLHAFWAWVDTRHGNTAGYLASALGVGAGEIGALRARWLV